MIALAALLLCASAQAVDGDTIACANQPVHIRLLAIDTPDKLSSAPCRLHYGDHVCDDALAAKATAVMRTLLPAGTVKLNPITHDRYGRLVAQVFVGRRDLQCALLRAGVARYLVKYDNGKRIAHRCPATVKRATDTGPIDLERLAFNKCGPEGYNDWDNWGPVCERSGWTGHGYRAAR